MTQKEKMYLRLGALFLAVGFVITFSCGTFRLGFFGRQGEGNRAELEAEAAYEEPYADNEITRAFGEGTIENLHIDAGYGEVFLYEGEQFYVETAYSTEDVYLNGNTLYIDTDGGVLEEESLVVSIPFGYLFQKAELSVDAGVLHIGQLYGKEVDISVGAGEFIGDSLVGEESCQINCGAGNTAVSDLRTENLKVTSGVGSVDLVVSQVGNVDIEAGIGDTVVTLPDTRQDFNYQINGGLGGVMINEESYGGMGQSYREDNGQPRLIRIENGVGTTQLYFME